MAEKSKVSFSKAQRAAYEAGRHVVVGGKMVCRATHGEVKDMLATVAEGKEPKPPKKKSKARGPRRAAANVAEQNDKAKPDDEDADQAEGQDETGQTDDATEGDDLAQINDVEQLQQMLSAEQAEGRNADRMLAIQTRIDALTADSNEGDGADDNA